MEANKSNCFIRYKREYLSNFGFEIWRYTELLYLEYLFDAKRKGE